MPESTDPRIAELEALAQEERIALPYPADYIIFLEDHGRMVDLVTSEVIYARLVATPTTHARAVAYLLANVDGELSL